MDIHRKVEILGQAAALDCEGPPALTREERKAQFIDQSRIYVTHPQRGKIPILRTMQTSACERNCYYCPFQAGRDYRRISFKPEELAATFDQMQRKRLVDGLFLSSGIIGGGVKAMDPMLDTVDILRRKYEYHGYIHLKIMPGAEAAQIERAARLADRLSINLEGANEQRLPVLAPKKDFAKELLPPLYWVRQNQHTLGPWVKLPSITTQFVVGPAGESDRELLTTAHMLPSDGQGHLPLGSDPKLVWAKTHLSQRPLEINRASRAELLRIPGIGPKTAEAIMMARRLSCLNDLNQLKQLGVQIDRVAPFILLNGRQVHYQLPLTGF
ncbi:MAG: radical SAM protein [Chloroflexi bacterium]|nr:radical SAM protein [Chloroflexota bacterium]